MDSTSLKRLRALQEKNADPNWVNRDIFRLMYKPDLYIAAYERIKSNPGNMTPGIDRETLDGFSLEEILRVVEEMKSEQFKFQRARRVYIPKKPKGKRPLGIGSPRQKIVQEVIKIILESVYDSPNGAIFRDCSHGFRPNRSVHSALRQIRYDWGFPKWFIEGDISKCFDKIDHNVLIALLRRKIDDERFLNLIRKALNAGYMEFRTPINSIIGTPQGSIISPILSNVYLHELDCFMQNLAMEYNKGERRAMNLAWKNLNDRIKRLSEKGEDPKRIKDLKCKLRLLPVSNPGDPNFRRLWYTRYADDFLIGVVGPKTDATWIRERARQFLHEELRLDLNLEKTLITNAQEDARYLGFLVSSKISRRHGTVRSNHGKQYRRQVGGAQTTLKAPIPDILAKLAEVGIADFKDGTARGKPKWWNILDHPQILDRYNAIWRGLYNYYRCADNIAKLNGIQYVIQDSIVRTLAMKFKISRKQVYQRFGVDLVASFRKGEKTYTRRFARMSFRLQDRMFAVNSPNLERVQLWYAKSTRSRLGLPCAVCGSADLVQMHHLKHIRKMGQQVKGFNKLLQAVNRKQIPLCKSCHVAVHNGSYDGKSLKDLDLAFV